MIKAKLLASLPSRMTLGYADIWKEVEKISEALGYNFTCFLTQEESGIYIVSEPNQLNPQNWHLLERVGTNRAPADSPWGLGLWFLNTIGIPFSNSQWDWAFHMYDCWSEDCGAIIEASRGFGKSVFMRASMSHQMGLYPDKSNLIIRASDTHAVQAVEQIAGIVTAGLSWRQWFDDIKPKLKPGQSGGAWSAHQGYQIVDETRLEDWPSIEAARTSPSLFKFGYGSKLLGGSVTGCLLIDDIHDRGNALNPTQREELIGLVAGDVLPMCWPGSKIAIIGTPQGTDDLLQRLPETPVYKKIRTPITKEGTYPGTPAWPEMFPEEEIKRIYDGDPSVGKMEFKKNRLLDLSATSEQMFHFSMFPHKKIEDTWFVRIGVDFAYKDAMDPSVGRSYFCAVAETQDPQSGAWIIIDGCLLQTPQDVSERMLEDLHRKYGGPNRVEGIFIEAVQTGDLWMKQIARSNPSMKLYPVHPGSASKRARWEADLQPAFANERIMVSDDPNIPFLEESMKALRSYPHIRDRGDKYADVLDALYVANYYALFQYGDPVRRRKKGGDKPPNPFFTLAGMK